MAPPHPHPTAPACDYVLCFVFIGRSSRQKHPELRRAYRQPCTSSLLILLRPSTSTLLPTTFPSQLRPQSFETSQHPHHTRILPQPTALAKLIALRSRPDPVSRVVVPKKPYNLTLSRFMTFVTTKAFAGAVFVCDSQRVRIEGAECG